MKKKLRVIELLIDEDNEKSIVNRISLVSAPAIEIDWVAFGKEEPAKTEHFNFKIEDGSKRYLTGIFMVPDQLTYRCKKDNLGNVVDEYYVTMSKDTIEKAMRKFAKNGLNNSTNLEHGKITDSTQDVYVIESWLVSKDNDKSKNYGFSAQEGSWAGTIYVENEKIWNEYIKTGQLKGFSIEGMFVMGEEQMSTNKEDLSNDPLWKLAEIMAHYLNK